MALTRIFKVQEDAADIAASAMLFARCPYLPARGFQGVCALIQKDNSPGSSRRRLRGMLGYPDEL